MCGVLLRLTVNTRGCFVRDRFHCHRENDAGQRNSQCLAPRARPHTVGSQRFSRVISLHLMKRNYKDPFFALRMEYIAVRSLQVELGA